MNAIPFIGATMILIPIQCGLALPWKHWPVVIIVECFWWLNSVFLSSVLYSHTHLYTHMYAQCNVCVSGYVGTPVDSNLCHQELRIIYETTDSGGVTVTVDENTFNHRVEIRPDHIVESRYKRGSLEFPLDDRNSDGPDHGGGNAIRQLSSIADSSNIVHHSVVDGRFSFTIPHTGPNFQFTLH